MKTNQMRKMVSMVTAFILSIALLTGCTQSSAYVTEAADGGVLLLKVNPEIAVAYDKDGKVTKVEAKNDDASKVLEGYASYEGKEARAVIAELVALIGKAGYFVEEVDGDGRKITLEIEKGSKLPSATFVEEMVSDIKDYVRVNEWKVPIDLVGESDYGIEYNDTDYGTDNDGVTDYNDKDDNDDQNNDTDYGPNNDGVTDYDDKDDNDDQNNDTDYGPNNDGVTDYNDKDDKNNQNNDTDYGPNNDGVTDYNSKSNGNSNYNDQNDSDDDSDDNDD